MLRKPAAQALEELFRDAEKRGSAYLAYLVIDLTSGKRAFAFYAKRDGEDQARTYSAYPGTSEHETD